MQGTWTALWLPCFFSQGQEYKAHQSHWDCLVSAAKDKSEGNMDCTRTVLFLQPWTERKTHGLYWGCLISAAKHAE